MGKYTEYYSAIEEIKTYLTRDLIGPVEPEEVLCDEEPLSRYVMGILWPRISALRAEEFDENIDADSEDAFGDDEPPAENDSIRLTNSFRPSSIAVSATIPADARTVSFTFDFAKYAYSEEPRAGAKNEATDEAGETEEKIQWLMRKYTRQTFSIASRFDVPSVPGNVECDSELPELETLLHVRKIMSDGSKLVTVSVSNTCESPKNRFAQSKNSLFQCSLRIESDRPFLPVSQNIPAGQDEDVLVNALLYRDIHSFAQGHGCAVQYAYDAGGNVTAISSAFFPSEQVLQMMPGTIENAVILRRAYWRNADKDTACQELRRFCGDYGMWRERQETIAKKLREQHQKAAKIVLERIDTCIDRIKTGISVLENDGIAWRAFTLMNEAMLLQQVKTRKGTAENSAWYPFQLAYILQILPDIVSPGSPYRNVVDLLWFPTGGGKTEAYLGVAAFVIFYRRLSRRPSSDGVTVLMRYTLRLLTLQQFDRAMVMICACEYLRRLHDIGGGVIGIGLWIGSNMTPNHLEEAGKVLQELKDDPHKRIYEGNPVQVTQCPWCGTAIDIGCYEIDSRMTVRCKNNPECDFHSELPICLIDDDIYKARPTLVLSTIDKFARIVWEENAKALFGFGFGFSVGGNNRDCPPDLIIQDELHLISGPLGTLSGLYETAVEKLCEQGSVRPKIIASTATVKNAQRQIRSLYNREMLQFPPSGMSFKDSFFAVEASPEERPARTYAGLCKMDGSLADLLIRVYADMSFIVHLFIKQGKGKDVVDQFYTTIGYFNAIRDLGASASIIQDRLSIHIRSLFKKFKREADAIGFSFKDLRYPQHDELTSRKTAKEVRETLNRLEIPHDDRACYSYVLASNMLSVGLDIGRLGLMTVYNQPKSNAEYIQATSRVGRQNPGLVLTMYNAMRSRDKSHYEQFGHYHKSFYQHVEATSVTPFSAQAIEKALHCVFVALVRHTIKGMGANQAAARFRKNMEGVEDVRKFILNRVRAVSPASERDAGIWLEWVIEAWDDLARRNEDRLRYKGRDEDGEISLLNIAGKGNILFPAILNSLRNVELSSNVYIRF
ncbi:MAG: hypothetical protein LBS35_11230 [Synergistaceae bacterium]|jgi:hypothetical protein|nr:hypothetical protein [Synergistaceae bacterium]